jgi:hypothetical protein
MESREAVRQKMFDLIGQWKTSELSQKAFCLQHQVPYGLFHYWYKRYREVHNAAGPMGSSFIPLQIDPVTVLTGGSHYELIYPDGRRLLFHQPVDAGFLKAVIG